MASSLFPQRPLEDNPIVFQLGTLNGERSRYGPISQPRMGCCKPLDGVKLRIGMLAACPFPANHGTPGSIREMAEAVSERGHDVHIVAYHFGEDIPVKGPCLHRISPLTGESLIVVGPTTRRPLYDLQMVFKTLQVIRKYHLDLIHAHGYEAALVGWLCRNVTGLPLLYSGHNTMADELPSYNFIRPKWLAMAVARMLDVFVPRRGDLCLPHSANMEKFFHGMGLASRTEPVVPFGIDLDPFDQCDGTALQQRYGLVRGSTVLYAGVLDEFQRLDLLLEAMGLVSRYEPKSKLLIIVTIPNVKHLAAIRRRVEELGIVDHVVITEPQTLDALPDLLAAGDVAVVPRPQAPGFPIKLLNYMAAKKPCVLFASSASTGLCHRDNVFLAAPDTCKALGEGILEVLRDDQLRERLAHNGNQFARNHHDRRLIAQKVCASYIRTLARTGRLNHTLWRDRVLQNLPLLQARKISGPSKSIERLRMEIPSQISGQYSDWELTSSQMSIY